MITEEEKLSDEIKDVIEHMKAAKPNDRSEKDRRFAVTITELEKAYAHFETFVVRS
jgi:hypothetical protein